MIGGLPAASAMSTIERSSIVMPLWWGDGFAENRAVFISDCFSAEPVDRFAELRDRAAE